MNRSLILLTVVLLAFGGMLFAGGNAEESGEVSEFRIGNNAEPESLDPHLISGVPENRIYQAIFEGLYAYDPRTADPVPGLAESFTTNEDNTEYTFKLRRTTWSDGTPITAQTVYDSWIRSLDPDTASPYAWFPSLFIDGAEAFNGGEAGPGSVGIEVVDDYTFRVKLAGPLPYVLDALAHYSFAVVPIHAIEQYGDEWTLPENFIGNGPFTVEEWRPQELLSVVPNETYWDSENVYLDRVVFLPVDDNNTAYNMYLNGELDWQTGVPLDRIREAQLRDDYVVNAQLASYYYHLNNKRPPLDDVRVRKALAYTIDRGELVERVTQGGQLPAYGIVPALSGYPAQTTFEEDVAEAQRLLAEAGFPNGENFPTLEVLYNTSEGHKKIAEYIQQQWKETLNIDIELVNQEWKTYLSTTREHDFDIARAGWVGDYQDPNTFLDLFVTDGGLNNSDYSNPQYDNLVERAATESPGAGRFDTLREAERIFIGEDQGIIPIYYYVNVDLVDNTKWDGWFPNVMGLHPVKDIRPKG